jgi:Gas vesicle synthesis protein GvpL/GvpF
VADDLARWAAGRAPDLLARAEAEAVAALRDALLGAALEGRRRAPAPSPPKPQPPAAPTGDALWTYCVMRAGDPAPDDLTGVVAAGPVTRVESGGLAALVSRVPLEEFGSEPLRENLNDLAWLERVARAHEAVLDGALAATTIVPLRLCTIYASEDRVRDMLDRERTALEEALQRLEGRQEWGVKLLVDRGELESQARAQSPDASALEGELHARTGGGAYMLQRRLDRQVREAADRLATEVAEDVHAHLQDWASDAVARPPQNRDLSGHEGEMLLNGAYLVEADRVEGLAALVAELEDRHRPLGARLELTGPWPPYNFVPPEGAAVT